ncbi:MFS transporter, sugar porter (SP) family [Dyadobacter koreensis]|uniref:MFS transporter, sugar porter (SP) family n=1 Tax=Dyadobacter koreensis TaxID=408657 RepID=A0A1H6V5V4_9BACT|nr:sugar porter family MFS transporter [Dyadobacter koreensis]SEI95672.1 MFS transporter, sugar porter (SP) family [Dyadobacter koreensis]
MKNSKVLVWSIVVALGGFLFGFDTAVISGAEKAIQILWKLTAVEHGFTVSIALIGTVIGAMLGGIPADRLGRKQTLFWIAILYLISSLGSALVNDWYLFLIFRFMGGLGVGASSVAAPMYISEISPAKSRGKMVGLFQFNVVFGILIAYFSNYFMQDLGENAWRWMLGIQAVPSLVFLLAILYVPESPRWLVMKKGKYDEAREILELIDPETSEETLSDILTSTEDAQGHPKARLFSAKYKSPVGLAVMFAIFNQVSGINAIIYYSPRIFEMTGLGTKSAFLSSAGIGFVNFAFTLLAINFIDRFGRRTLMLIGSVGLIITLSLVARAFFIQDFTGVPIFLFVYIAFFAFSQGAVIWVFISEIFPNEVRANGQALGSFTHWFMAAVVAFSFPIIAEFLGGGITFSFFAVMMVLQLIFVWRVMPETKGTSLERLEKTMVIH